MRKASVRVVAVLWFALLVQACGSSGNSGSSATPGTASRIDSAPVTVGWNGPPTEEYLPMVMAVSAMRKQGFQIQTKVLGSSNLVFQAMAAGQVQFTGDSLDAGAYAAQGGVPVKIVATRESDLVVWAVQTRYKDCGSLSGRPVGIYAPVAGYTTLMNLYFASNCPGVHPTLAIIPDSGLRAQALANGTIDGTTLALADALQLQAKNVPNISYVYFSNTMPGIGDEYIYADNTVINSHPTIVQALLKGEMDATRYIYTHPSQLGSLFTQYLSINDSSSTVAGFLNAKLWDANGGLDGPGCPATLKAFKDPGSCAQLIDAGPLNAALQQIGRSSLTPY